jgi:MFS transporter, DHA1 family, inner membrane transport protein
VLAVLCVSAFIGILSSLAVGPFLPYMAADFGVPVGVLGQVPAATMLIGAVLGLAIGPLADRHGKRRMLLAGAAAVVASATATAAAQRGDRQHGWNDRGGGLARATMLPVTLSAVSGRLAGPAQRRAVSMVSASVSVSAIGGVPVLTAIAAAYGWRAAFVTLAAVAAAVMLLLRLVLAPDRTPPHCTAEADRSRTSPPAAGRFRLAGVVRTYAPLFSAPGARGVQGIIITAALRNVTAWGFLTYLGAFLAQQHQLGPQEVGWAFLASGAGHFSGSLLVGGRVAPGGGTPLRAVFAGLHLVSGVLFGAAFALPLPVLGAIATFVSASTVTGAADVVTTRLLVAETPAGRATTLTLNGSGTSLGGALGGSLGGLLLSLFGFGAVGLMVFTTATLAALATWLSRPRATASTLGPALDRPLPQTA